jgi:Glucose / Sorbosone dehydrogenase
MRNGALYVATASRLLRFDDIEKHLDAPPAPVTLRDDLPNPKAGHTWKFIAFGPDDMLYMSVGSTCNVCAPQAMTAAILRMKPDGSGQEVFAEGVRNSVGFDWHPVTHELWFTDNGRDMLGDDVPNDELNIAPKAGLQMLGDDRRVLAESFANRIHRLRPGAKELDLWVAADPQLAGVDGIAIVADGSVYVNTFFAGRIFRIPVKTDGSAGALEPIETSVPLTRPDGLRTVGPQTLIQAEGQGRVAELTIKGNRAEVRVLQEGLTGATAVTIVGNTAFVLVERAKAVGVPYPPR